MTRKPPVHARSVHLELTLEEAAAIIAGVLLVAKRGRPTREHAALRSAYGRLRVAREEAEARLRIAALRADERAASSSS